MDQSNEPTPSIKEVISREIKFVAYIPAERILEVEVPRFNPANGERLEPVTIRYNIEILQYAQRRNAEQQAELKSASEDIGQLLSMFQKQIDEANAEYERDQQAKVEAKDAEANAGGTA